MFAIHVVVPAYNPGEIIIHATLDSGWWPTLTGQDSHLLGRIDGLPSCLSVYMASSITKLRLAQSMTGATPQTRTTWSAVRATHASLCSHTRETAGRAWRS